ncbi:hypothetical protein N478_03595 [Pseudoalteromonas luteoviolacea S4060-1]|uniref:Uncharacterized protein n=1 Tax=Pseudoalteromonas luteoviolacea S4060-1 TaxID=1365257 RepID=A0A167KVG7_9GAMM|nr:hypothetical protein N478_03595 [Pseudoalteromonas luteoviolacea S4060-1]
MYKKQPSKENEIIAWRGFTQIMSDQRDYF